MNEVKRARFNDLLVRLFGMDAGPPAPFVAGELVPVFNVANPLDSDLRWIRTEKRYGGCIDATAGAGFPQVRLRNPVGSGVLVILESIVMSSAARMVCGLGAVTTDIAQLPAAGTFAAHDSRAGISSGLILNRGAANLTWDNNAPTQIQPNVFNVSGGGVPLIFLRELVMGPGSGIDCWCPTAAATAQVSLGWRERPIDQLELNA